MQYKCRNRILPMPPQLGALYGASSKSQMNRLETLVFWGGRGEGNVRPADGVSSRLSLHEEEDGSESSLQRQDK